MTTFQTIPTCAHNKLTPVDATPELALLFQYLRVYEKGCAFRKATIMTIIVVCLWSAMFAVLAWVPCVPIRAYWDYDIPAVRYAFGTFDVDQFIATYTSLTASNMVLDMVILGLAAPLLLYGAEGQTDARSRWALVSLFGIGSL